MMPTRTQSTHWMFTSVGVLAGCAVAAAQEPGYYRLIDLGPVPAAGYIQSHARSLNDNGVVVGYSYTTGVVAPLKEPVFARATLWSDANGDDIVDASEVLDLGTLSASLGNSAWARAISNVDIVVGSAVSDTACPPGPLSNPHMIRAFAGPPMAALPGIVDSVIAPDALGVNNAAQIVGYRSHRCAESFKPAGTPLVWEAGPASGPIELPEPGALPPGLGCVTGLEWFWDEGLARAISDRPAVCVGWRSLRSAIKHDPRAIRWVKIGGGWQAQDLGSLSGDVYTLPGQCPRPFNSEAWAINSDGQIVGWSEKLNPGGPNVEHAFLWFAATEQMIDLGVLPGDSSSVALGINDLGVVVGLSNTTALGGQNHAFAWFDSNGNAASDPGEMVDLQSRLVNPACSCFQLESATDVNNNGWICGRALTPDGVSHAVLLRPVIGHCPGDINESGTVNVEDLLAVINGWGACPGCPVICPVDINCSGTVDVDDLLAVIGQWGLCP